MNKPPLIESLETYLPEYTDRIEHFDQVQIHDEQKPSVLKKKLPVDLLKKRCIDFSIQRADDIYREYGWHTRITITVPSPEFIRRLQFHESKLKNYKISRGEPAVDYLMPDRSLRELSRIVEQLGERLVLRYAHKDLSFDVSCKDNKKKTFDSDKGFFTLKISSESWALAIYVRESKLTGINCIHVEWQCFKTQSVKSVLGISTIADLARFDHVAFWSKRDRYISNVKYRIDRKLTCKFLVGIDGRKRFDPPGNTISEMRHSVYLNAWLKLDHFLSGVHSITDFKKQFADEKKRIRKKKGRLSGSDKRMLNANYKRFLKPVDIIPND